jgi:hypothetical protein
MCKCDSIDARRAHTDRRPACPVPPPQVLPLHPAVDRDFRKPYEILLIGARRSSPATTSLSASPPSAAVLAPSAVASSAAPILPPIVPLPREYILFSVPGSRHHSRKPQLQGQFSRGNEWVVRLTSM